MVRHVLALRLRRTGSLHALRAAGAGRTYQRPAAPDARTGRGWQVRCDGCGEQLTSSLGGLVLALSETRKLRASRC